jgi:hypothetical protein
MTMGYMTILEARRNCAKTHRWAGGRWETTAFDEPFNFEVNPIECSGVDHLYEILRWLEIRPQHCVIHGVLLDGREAFGRRIMHDQLDQKTGKIEPARFRAPDAAQWLCIDIDKVPCPAHLRDGYDAETMRARLDHLSNEFPADFADVSYVYQWSASAGLNGWDTLSAHLWFWIDNPKPLDQIKARAKEEAWPCDLSLFSPVQVHYTAAPAFQGARDPIEGQRTGIVHRSRDAVTLVNWIAPEKPTRTVGERLVGLTTGSTLDEILDKIGHHLHGPISHAIAHYVVMTPPDERDKEWIKDQVRGRVLMSPRPDRLDFADDAYLNRSYDGAAFKYQPVNTDRMKLALARQTLKNWNKKKGTHK